MMKFRGSSSISKDSILVPYSFAKHWKLVPNQNLLLKYGINVVPVKILTSKNVQANQIIASVRCLHKLKIPEECTFQFNKYKSTLTVGPYIGILVDRTRGKVPTDSLLHYVQMDSLIGGSILVFSPGDVNLRDKTIGGYMYIPSKRTWRYGQYHYPASILNKSSANDQLITHLNNSLGKTIFNDYHLDKWTMHKVLSKNASIRKLLPKTVLYHKPQDIAQMFNQCPEVYMKPIRGSLGKHILKLSKQRNKIVVTYNGTLQKQFGTVRELGNFVKTQTHHSQYLLQERIQLISLNDRLIDFRVIIVKDENGNWQWMGIYSRYGPRKYIVSNISAGGTAQEGTRTLKKILKMGEAEIRTLRGKMERSALHIAKQLETSGLHVGNIGFDFALDTQKRLWLIEVNHNNPNHTIALDAGEKHIFLKTIRANMLYAKKLAGFGRSISLKGKRR
ncbi:YheC/YheD family protein [Paenibacillus sp. RC67]|uniref:YheC/YheD family endospore coat-associated protein n=1 Tax=Paenibacillus sp. RC67 TaxID=3039392 RepID=UPI0024AD2AA0|nr:YheC/YheD family protein [Paenibacillus sp. RC67]